MAEKPSQQTRDLSQVIKYLTTTFNNLTSKLEKPGWTNIGPNQTYVFQSEFAYLIHEITMGAPCMIQKNIGACNDYIDYVVQTINNK